jgi:hypothetical protein
MKDSAWSRVNKNGVFSFGFQFRRNELRIIVPQFIVSDMGYFIDLVNRTPKKHHDHVHETRLKVALNQPNGRVVKRGNHLVPLDEDAASMLYQLKIPMAKTQRAISIKKVVEE